MGIATVVWLGCAVNIPFDCPAACATIDYCDASRKRACKVRLNLDIAHEAYTFGKLEQEGDQRYDDSMVYLQK